MGIWKTVLLLTAALIIVLLVSRSIRKAVCVAAGYGIYALFGELYDKILWPIVQGRYGLTGAAAMSAGALVINFSLLIVYQKCGVDWLGVSLLDDLQKRTGQFRASLQRGTVKGLLLYFPVMAMQAAVWMLRTPWSAFLLLTVWEDSFVTTAFLRQGRFGPLEKRDIAIFAVSSFVGCGFWIIWSAGVVAVFSKLWLEITNV